MKSLLKHRAVREVEDYGMDEGRFFVHLKDGWDWCYDPHNVTITRSFGSVKEAREALKHIKKIPPAKMTDISDAIREFAESKRKKD